MVTVDFEERVLLGLRDRASALGLSLDVVVNDELRHVVGHNGPRHPGIEAGIVAMVQRGLSDADIAEATHMVVQRIATIRRDAGLPANKRYRRWD